MHVLDKKKAHLSRSQYINSLRPGDVYYIHQCFESSFTQIITSCQFNANPIWTNAVLSNYILKNKIQWHFNENIEIVCQENASKNAVCKMLGILLKNQSLKGFIPNCSLPHQPPIHHTLAFSFSIHHSHTDRQWPNNGECHPGGHHWDYSTGTLSLFHSSQFTVVPMKISC